MKKIVVAIIFSFFILSLPSMTAGMTVPKKSETKPVDLGWTFIRGIITRPKLINGGNDVVFHAIFVHYKTHWVGVTRRGFLHNFQSISLPNDYLGIMRNHYVFAKFYGKMST
jgi:hypothetical protein